MATERLNVLVMAPILGTDVSYLEGIDPRLEVIDGNHLFSSKQADDAERKRRLAGADVLILGFPCRPKSPVGHPGCSGSTTPKPASRTSTTRTCGARTCG